MIAVGHCKSKLVSGILELITMAINFSWPISKNCKSHSRLKVEIRKGSICGEIAITIVAVQNTSNVSL